MKTKLMLAGLSLLAFIVSLIGLLGLQGRLNYQGTRGIPLLGSLFHAPEAGEKSNETKPAPEAQTRPADSHVEPAPAHAGGEGTPPAQAQGGKRGPRSLFEFPPLQSNISPEEMTAVLLNLEIRRRDLDRRESHVAREKDELTSLARDMEERRKAIRADMAAVQSASEDVDMRATAFREKSSVLGLQEQKNYKDQAERFAVMEPAKAAELLLEMGPDGEEKAVKLLSLMDAETAARVIGEMDPKRGARIVSRSLQMIREPARPPGR